MAEAKWYAIQTYSGHENKVQRLVQRRIEEEPGEPEAVEDNLGLGVSQRLLDKLGGGVFAGPQGVRFAPGPMRATTFTSSTISRRP